MNRLIFFLPLIAGCSLLGNSANIPSHNVGFTDSMGLQFSTIPSCYYLESPAVLGGHSQCGPCRRHSFQLSRTEITQRQWFEVMGTRPWAGKAGAKEGDQYPAVYISIDEMKLFCKALSAYDGNIYRLPSVFEWEIAFQAPTPATCLPSTDDGQLARYSWFKRNSVDLGRNWPNMVATLLPNCFGLFDMQGNVWEQCGDFFALLGGFSSNGPNLWVACGGCWESEPHDCGPSSRLFTTGEPMPNVGFRVLRELP